MIRQFVRLERAERWVVLEIAVTTVAVAAALRTLPFAVFARAVGARLHRRRTSAVSAYRTAALVEGVARRIPGSTCLVKAVVLFVVLLRRGIETEVIVAAARTSGRLDAHAWVRFQDAVILGEPERDGYVPVLVLRVDTASSATAA